MTERETGQMKAQLKAATPLERVNLRDWLDSIVEEDEQRSYGQLQDESTRNRETEA